MTRVAAAKRWSAEGWLFLREGGTSSVTGHALSPSYGGSQTGAILRYRLAPRAAADPAVYLRVSDALGRGGEREAALGLSVRPLSAFPLTAHAELRATDRAGDIELRPAAFLVIGGEHSGLPLSVSVRGYAQAGYAGGRYATAFADGQLVAERDVSHFDLGTLRVGAGAWGGVQRDTGRLDIGPTVSLSTALGHVPLRASLDYRLRIAGAAEPAGGAALTVSTGF